VRIRRSLVSASACIAAMAVIAACSGGNGAASSGGASSGGTGSTSAPAGATDTGATINVGSIYEPQNLDNTAGGGQGVTEALNGNVYEGLYKLGDDGKVTPLLATADKVSDDGLTYTFTLRDGVKFHSGAAMTSEDVKFSIEKVLGPDSQSARKGDLQVIDAVETPDAHTVVVKLKQRSISLTYNLSYVWIMNHAATNLKTTEDGTGPYQLDKWQHGSTLSLKRFAGYWGTPAKNGEVVYHYYQDASAENNALLAGQLDVITGEQSPDALAQFDNNPQFTVNNGSSTTKLLLAFNDKVKPFDNKELRVAITEAIDRHALLQSIWGTYGKVTGSMVPPTDPWYEDMSNVYPYDVAKAKADLAAAGYASGLTFTLDTPNYAPHPTAAAFIKDSLAKIGVTVNINIITPDQWYTKVYKNRDFTATMQEHVNDRDVVWYGNPDFYWGYDNPDVTKLVDEAESSQTTADQTAKLKQANEIIVKDAASDWMYLYPQIVVSKSTVTGYPINGLNSQFYAYNITKTK